jgi:hypothetical protein
MKPAPNAASPSYPEIERKRLTTMVTAAIAPIAVIRMGFR